MSFEITILKYERNKNVIKKFNCKHNREDIIFFAMYISSNSIIKGFYSDIIIRRLVLLHNRLLKHLVENIMFIIIIDHYRSNYHKAVNIGVFLRVCMYI